MSLCPELLGCHDGTEGSVEKGPGLLNWLASRAREGGGGFAGGGFLFRDYQIGDGSDLLRGEVGGRRQSHPGSIDRGVEPWWPRSLGSGGVSDQPARSTADSATGSSRRCGALRVRLRPTSMVCWG